MRWVAVYSKTGGEIKRIAGNLGREPDLLLKDPVDLAKYLHKDDLVTLHGYMRIVPADICERFTIYNGHPGLINEYPELRGKDPQERSQEYKIIGSVVHRVIAEVDAGEIVAINSTKNNCVNKTCLYDTLRHTSLLAWLDFFKAIGLNNGGPTSYYDFKPGWTEAGDVIEGRDMNFNQGNIFKCAFCFNIGRHNATNYERELNKIIYFAQRELKRIKK